MTVVINSDPGPLFTVTLSFGKSRTVRVINVMEIVKRLKNIYPIKRGLFKVSENVDFSDIEILGEWGMCLFLFFLLAFNWFWVS